jgi:hypothetical protein
MQAGRKRHTAYILGIPHDLDLYGKQKDPEPLFRIRCNVQIISGTELVKAGFAITSEYITVLASFNSKVTQSNLFKWKDGIYNIDMIKPDDRSRDMIITASREF